MADFPEKLKLLIAPEWRDGVETKDKAELQQEISKASANISDVNKEIKENARVQALKEELKEIMGPFRETIKVEQAKVEYCLFLMRSRGYM